MAWRDGLHRCAIASLLVLPACGDDGTSTGRGASTTASSSSGPPATTRANDTRGTGVDTTTTVTGGGLTSTGRGPDSGVDGSGSDSDSSSSGSSGSSGSMVGSTGDLGNGVYSAMAMPGALDRIRINKANLDDNRCTWIVLAAPPGPSFFPGITVPVGWSVESVFINDIAAACDSDNPVMFGSELAIDANGAVMFGMIGGTGIYPCTIDIDAVFDFQGILPGIPAMDAMVASDVPVMGC